MRLALFEPDIPQNTGTILRLAACLGLGVDIIEPCGFAFSDRRLKRAGMDYIDRVSLIRHDSWADFETDKGDTRLILLTTKADLNYCEFNFTGTDTLLLGRESAGVPAQVHVVADARLTIPMSPDLRSLNIATAAAMVLGEALRQTGGFSTGYEKMAATGIPR